MIPITRLRVLNSQAIQLQLSSILSLQFASRQSSALAKGLTNLHLYSQERKKERKGNTRSKREISSDIVLSRKQQWTRMGKLERLIEQTITWLVISSVINDDQTSPASKALRGPFQEKSPSSGNAVSKSPGNFIWSSLSSFASDPGARYPYKVQPGRGVKGKPEKSGPLRSRGEGGKANFYAGRGL